ncbi:hypothetical protein [Pseudokordiimonas caeni]|uniref:hypothetical protein n=1 Tax=Pseudokordiimonas caeni TaxID=2997908 RepID=UPI0028126DE5|nr:hypothetical protein [Pseudokordiimonas caeni]
MTGSDHFSTPETAHAVGRAALLPKRGRKVDGAGWDRFIGFMRIALPAIALVLGGLTLFWPFINSQEVSFTLSKEEVSEGDGTVRMTNLNYTGTDKVNRLFNIHAASGVQEDPTAPRVRLSDIRAEMDIEPFTPAVVTARTGIYRLKDGTLSLIGGVTVRVGADYDLRMAGAEVDLRERRATGQGDIQGKSPLGTLDAERVELLVDEQTAIFDGGVSFHIVPKRTARTNESAKK